MKYNSIFIDYICNKTMSNIKAFVESVSDKIKHIHRNRSTNLKPWCQEENDKDIYAILPPIEMYMDVSPERLERHTWSRIEDGTVIVGRVSSKSDYGLFVRVICFDGGKIHYTEELDIVAHCPKSEIPTVTNHENPISRFAVGDLVRGVVIAADYDEQELVISFQRKYNHFNMLLGVITLDDLPVSYKRCSSSEGTYDKMLSHTAGFYNPSSIQYLRSRLVLGICPSFIEDIKGFVCPPEEYADQLRKSQSAKVAAKAVSRGVELYRKGKSTEALQELNHALDLDAGNIEALVARGAIYANKLSFSKAISDFELALKFDVSHANAKKYLVEVLVERAKSIEISASDLDQIKEASRLYKQALSLDQHCEEAKTALGALERHKQNSKKPSSSTESVSSSSDDLLSAKTATIVRVKSLLEKDMTENRGRHKSHNNESKGSYKRQRSKISHARSSSSSSSSSTSLSSSSSSSEADADTSKSKAKRRSSSSSNSKHKTPKRRRLSSNSTSTKQSKRETYDHSTSSHKRSSPRKSDHWVKGGRRDSRSISSTSDNLYTNIRDSLPLNSQKRRQSSSGTSHRYVEKSHAKHVIKDQGDKKHFQASHSGRSAAPITTVNKDTFSSILDQISKFQGNRKT